MNRKECKSRIVPTAEYITVLDFEVGRVFQYDIGVKKNWNPDHESCEKFLTDVGHRLNNCEWMVHYFQGFHVGSPMLNTI